MRRATKGYVTGRRPAYGYKLSEDKLHYEIYEERAHRIKQIFDWYTSGESLLGIAEKLNRQGIPTPLGAKRWRPETIRKILRREVYKGVFIANRHEKVYTWEGGRQKSIHRLKPESEWIYVTVPAIVSENQWEEIQKILDINKQKSMRHARKNKWLLSGLVRCILWTTIHM